MSQYARTEGPFVNPSLLSADFANLKREMTRCQRAKCRWIHLDIMDGHFVPNLTIGPIVVKWLRAANARLFFDTHLMIEDPLKFAPEFAKAGASLITVHQETVEDMDRAIRFLRRLGVQVGVCIKPRTPVETLRPFLKRIDLALVMSVEPGFGGQEMIPQTLHKVRELSLLREDARLAYKIEIDGGINCQTIGLAAAAGADVLVAGSAVFNNAAPVAENLRALRAAMGAATGKG